MNRAELIALIKRKQSFLCVGLDTDPSKLPSAVKQSPNPVLEFNKRIIESTLPYTVCYKLNIAFYESMGEEGWNTLRQTIALIPKGEALIIADAKRGDIGNTAAQYAKAFFGDLDCDAITINPYMGKDSVTPFLEYDQKWSIVLGITSNPGASDVELLKLDDGRFVFEATIDNISQYGNTGNMMFVVGATKAEYFEKVRKVAPDHFLLIPGVGAQGGSLEDLKSLLTPDVAILVNSSRGIIYASSDADYADAAGREANRLQMAMSEML